MKTLIALAALALVACGTENPAKAPDSVASVAVVGTAAPASSPAPAPAPAPVDHSLAVADSDALPACDQAAEGWLVYVKADATFKACLGGGWATVDVRGAKGDAGVAGTDGANGIDGKDGANGERGDQGIAGADGATGAKGDQGERGEQGADAPGGKFDASTIWADPDTGHRWYFASEAATYADALTTCAAGFALPTSAMPYKLYNYFVVYMSTTPATAAYWSGPTSTRTLGSNGFTTVAADGAESHYVLCEGQP